MKQVILVTDGDESAKKAIELSAKYLGATCITESAGNPTTLTGSEIIELILLAPCNPVLVMFDDSGWRYEGPGEHAMRLVHDHPNIEVIGAIAVASSTHSKEWAKVDVSIDRYGELTEYGVDKDGFPDLQIGRINGDSVYILDEWNLPIVVGIGDIGKMGGYDSPDKGALITREAIQLILERSGKFDS
ncbi:stage V sporulation protein AE [Alkalihalobacillus trypoxylicola]|uniref:Stage V sporulation protein AE n=1 Tax=Alkalihalobacillus trypoxylicola TaxID=519424 RepID=A0A162DSI8_9BACI|nr:stage V sporulation protein AE [Alkalihalobacillus trypoxylicola]KYG30714.1 stage V sporulation protein AE [Alkalihalobacillus trypoxylicola]